MDDTCFYCLIVVTVNAFVLLGYHYYLDPHKDIERYYLRNNKVGYALLTSSYYVIVISMMLCLRYLASSWYTNTYGKS